jgi:hypothetical protein
MASAFHLRMASAFHARCRETKNPRPSEQGLCVRSAKPMPFLEGWNPDRAGDLTPVVSPDASRRGDGIASPARTPLRDDPRIQLRDSAGLSPASLLTPAPAQREAHWADVVGTHVRAIRLYAECTAARASGQAAIGAVEVGPCDPPVCYPHGDADCSEAVESSDGLDALRFAASLRPTPTASASLTSTATPISTPSTRFSFSASSRPCRSRSR